MCSIFFRIVFHLLFSHHVDKVNYIFCPTGHDPISFIPRFVLLARRAKLVTVGSIFDELQTNNTYIARIVRPQHVKNETDHEKFHTKGLKVQICGPKINRIMSRGTKNK